MNARELTAEQIEIVKISLRTGLTITQSIRSACGGRVPAWAFVAIGRARDADPVLGSLCEAADKREAVGAKAPARRIANGKVQGATGTATREASGAGEAAEGERRDASSCGATEKRSEGMGKAPASTIVVAQSSDVSWAKLRALVTPVPAEIKPSLHSAWCIVDSDNGTPCVCSVQPTERWARAYEEVVSLGGSNLNYGRLLYVEKRCVDRGLHPMDRWWLKHHELFYLSGAFEDVDRVGVRGAKSDSKCRAIVAETTLMPRLLEATVNARCPVMSANVTEAGDRFVTIKEILRALGLNEIEGRNEIDVSTFKSSGGGNAPHVCELFDSQGHLVKFQVSAANEASAAGFTGVSGLCDELDLWGKATGANPALKVLRTLRSRYATQQQAKLHIVSATYERDSEHSRLIALGNVSGQYVARIGEDGSKRDHEARLRLSAKTGNKDPLLIAPPLPPDSPDVPSWVTNPLATIESAYAKSKGDLREMFGLYGGRLSMSGNAPPLAEVSPMIDERAASSCPDIVVGVAAPDSESREWGIVSVGIIAGKDGGMLVIDDVSGTFDGYAAAERILEVCVARRGSVLAVPVEQADAVTEEIAAAFAGSGTPVAPIAAQRIRDGNALRTGPMRTLYNRSRLRHAPDLDALLSAVRMWNVDKRSPRVEALTAAVLRLLACYPWLNVSTDEGQPIAGPKTIEYGLAGGNMKDALIRKLGGKP